MLGPRNLLMRHALFSSALGLYLSACSGTEFASGGVGGGSGSAGTGDTSQAGQSVGGSDSGTNGGDAAAGDTSPAGGTGGSVSTGGNGGGTGGVTGGSGGSAGSGTVCACPAGQYCRDGSTTCNDCSAVNRLNFSTPERLAQVSPAAGSDFPRTGSTANDLFFRVEGAGISYTKDYATSPGSSMPGTTAADSSPLLLSGDAPIVGVTLMTFNFLFDRAVGASRKLFIGKWSGSALATHEAAPPPYNGSKNDYSPALTAVGATGSARLYWMTDRGNAPALVTTLIGDAAAAAFVNVELGETGCKADDPDLTPWVTADGKVLLFSGTACADTAQGKDIYTALLQTSTGLPTAPARPMNDINSPKDDVSPSFSADMCELYFASDRDGKFAVYRAKRR